MTSAGHWRSTCGRWEAVETEPRRRGSKRGSHWALIDDALRRRWGRYDRDAPSGARWIMTLRHCRDLVDLIEAAPSVDPDLIVAGLDATWRVGTARRAGQGRRSGCPLRSGRYFPGDKVAWRGGVAVRLRRGPRHQEQWREATMRRHAARERPLEGLIT